MHQVKRVIAVREDVNESMNSEIAGTCISKYIWQERTRIYCMALKHGLCK